MELIDANFDKAVDAKIIDEKFKGLQWISYKYKDNPKKELNLLVKSKKCNREK